MSFYSINSESAKSSETGVVFEIDNSEDVASIALSSEDGGHSITVEIEDYSSFPLKNQLNQAVESSDFALVLEVAMKGKDEEFLKSWKNHPANS